MEGPFGGAAILDGAEVMDQARGGGAATPFATKSPLYPWLLGRALGAGLPAPWTVVLLGLAFSLASLRGIAALCRRLGLERGTTLAMGAWVLCSGPLCFAVQPLPVLAATALLLWGVVALLAEGPRATALGGALLGAAACTRAPLALPALALLVWRLGRGRGWPALVGAVLVVAACLGAFGERAWPSGGALNLRLGNGAFRTGVPDQRPGPAYDRLRLDAVQDAWSHAASELRPGAFHARRLAQELARDPAGAAVTLARKAFLFFHRTEIHTGADFRHGLGALMPLPLMLLGFGLVAPLGLLGLLRLPRPALLLPVAGVFVVNLAFLTSARYRLPALPFLCVAAGAYLAARPRGRSLAAALGLCLVLNLNPTGLDLTFAGDGWAQQGRLWLASGREREALAPLERAVAARPDPRAQYDLALACEARARSGGGAEWLDRAAERYRQALQLDPTYPQAGENLMALLLRRGRAGEARGLGEGLVANSPWAGKAHLNLAVLLERDGQAGRARALRLSGHRILALRACAQNDRAGARLHAAQLRRLDAADEVLEGWLGP